MALTSATLSNYDEVLKTFYLPAIREQLNNETILAKFLEANEEDVSGKDATIECHYGRSTGSGARGDGASLPSADYQKYKTATVPMKYNYGRIEVTGPTLSATRDERGAFIKALDSEIRGMVSDVKKEVNRQLWGCGYGVLARWAATSSSTAYDLQKLYTGNAAGGDGFGSAFGGKYFEERGDGVVVVLNSASSAGSADFTVDSTSIAVSAISTSGLNVDTITCTDPSVSEAAGTFYVRSSGALTSLASSGGHRKEMMGLRGIVTDTDLDDIVGFDGTNSNGFKTNDPLQGLDVSTYSWWKAQVDDSGTRYGNQRALTLNIMQKMFDKVEEKAGKDNGPDMILTTRAIRREYLDLCRQDKRFVNTMELDGGFKALDYNGVPFTVDDDAIDGEIYFLTTNTLKIYRMSDFDWMQRDGAILSRRSGYDAYEAVLFRYAELGCTRRNVNGVLCDINYEA